MPGVTIRNPLQSASKKLIEPRTSNSIAARLLRKHIARSRKRVVRIALVSANLLVLFLVVGFVASTELTPDTSGSRMLDADTEATGPLDQLSSADIAVNVARLVSLPEATSVANHADSVNATLLAPQSDNSIVAKPVVMSTALPTKYDIQSYVVQEGDTIGDIAVKFGVSSDSVRWSNDLTGDEVAVGTRLILPPSGVDGIVYKVATGDTADSLAEEYNTGADNITSFNDAELSGLVAGDMIVIPGGSIAAPEPVYNYGGGYAFGFAAQYGYNGYEYGWCTWWAATRRQEIGRPIPANLGDAYTWVARGRMAGLSVSSTPRVGSVIWSNTYYPGHVGFVEEVLSDGSIWVSDMNSYGQVSKTDSTPAGGWNRVSWKKISPSQFGGFQFIN